MFPKQRQGRGGSRADFDMTDDATLKHIFGSAEERGLQVHHVVSLGGPEGFWMILTDKDAPCACGLASNDRVDPKVVNYARSLVHAYDLAAVRMMWEESPDSSDFEIPMSFEEFEARNESGSLASNTPYRLHRAECQKESEDRLEDGNVEIPPSNRSGTGS